MGKAIPSIEKGLAANMGGTMGVEKKCRCRHLRKMWLWRHKKPSFNRKKWNTYQPTRCEMMWSMTVRGWQRKSTIEDESFFFFSQSGKQKKIIAVKTEQKHGRCDAYNVICTDTRISWAHEILIQSFCKGWEESGHRGLWGTKNYSPNGPFHSSLLLWSILRKWAVGWRFVNILSWWLMRREGANERWEGGGGGDDETVGRLWTNTGVICRRSAMNEIKHTTDVLYSRAL